MLYSRKDFAFHTTWQARLVRRFQTLWFLKMLLTIFGITAFFIVYFHLLRHPIYPVTIMPMTLLDRMIGFCPIAVPLYLSLWVYVSLGLAFMPNKNEILTYCLSASAMSFAGLSVFLLWPTATPAFDVDWSLYPYMSFLKSHDLAGNAFPSMHVAFSVYTAMLLETVLRQIQATYPIRVFNWLWCLGILYSTLATAQHVALDVAGGAALGLTATILHLHLLRHGEAKLAAI